MDIKIRPYVEQDRPSVRSITLDTADARGPMSGGRGFREFAADLLTLYYTDYEPQSLWVAVSGGEVIGYVGGSMDSRRYFRAMALKVIPFSLMKAMVQGLVFQKKFWQLLGAALASWTTGRSRPDLSPDEYAAHVHINIASGFRQRNLGSELLEVFLSRAREAGVKGIYASVREDNVMGKSFFAKKGFRELAERAVICFDNDRPRAGNAVIFVKEMS